MKRSETEAPTTEQEAPPATIAAPPTLVGLAQSIGNRAFGRAVAGASAPPAGPPQALLARRRLARQSVPDRDPEDAGTPDPEPVDASTAVADPDVIDLSALAERLLAWFAEHPQTLRDMLRKHVETPDGLRDIREGRRELSDSLATMRANRSDVSGVPAGTEAANRRIELHEGVLRVVDEVLAELDDFLDVFEAQGLVLITDMLAKSAAVIAGEKRRYGLSTTTELHQYGRDDYVFTTTHAMGSDTASQDLQAAAAALAAKVAAIRAATDAVNDTMGLVPDSRVEGGMSYGVADERAHAAAQQGLDTAQREYDLLRYEKEAQFPILAAFTPIDRSGGTSAIDATAERLKAIAAGGRTAADELAPDVDERLENIATVSEAIADGDVRVWEMPEIVELTKQQLAVRPGSAREAEIDRRVSDAKTFRVARDILLGVVAIALSIAAAPLTGGASLTLGAAVVAGTASVGAAGLSIYMAADHLREYRLEKAKAGSAFDRAHALSQEEPSLFWLALDIVGAVTDTKAALTAFKELSVIATAAVRARRAATTAQAITAVEHAELAELRTAAAKQGKKVGAPAEFAERITTSAEHAAAGERAELTGVYKRWESELNEESKALLKDESLSAAFRDMDPELREVLTRCGSACIPTGVTKAQAKRLRALLDRIPKRHREGLREFLYHHRENMDTAIADLEHLFTADLGKEAEKALTRLEEGAITSEGELVSVSRRGKAGDVPDLAPGERAQGREALEEGHRVPLDVLKRNQRVLGKRIADAPEEVLHAWNAAAEEARNSRGALTIDNYRELYKDTQQRFWAKVRKDTTAAAWFESNGFDFARTQSGAPAVSLPYTGGRARKELAIELDHIAPKATGDNWRHALDADNLQFITGWDNWLLNQIERVSPELGRP